METGIFYTGTPDCSSDYLGVGVGKGHIPPWGGTSAGFCCILTCSLGMPGSSGSSPVDDMAGFDVCRD